MDRVTCPCCAHLRSVLGLQSDEALRLAVLQGGLRITWTEARVIERLYEAECDGMRGDRLLTDLALAGHIKAIHVHVNHIRTKLGASFIESDLGRTPFGYSLSPWGRERVAALLEPFGAGRGA